MGLLYKLQLPKPAVADVTVRTVEQTVTVDVQKFPATDGMPLRYQQGMVVKLRLQDTDDAGNTSPWSDPLTFTATDEMAPPAPGQLGVTPTGEDTNTTDYGPMYPQPKKK